MPGELLITAHWAGPIARDSVAATGIGGEQRSVSRFFIVGKRRGAGDQGSRGAGEKSHLAPLPPCPLAVSFHSGNDVEKHEVCAGVAKDGGACGGIFGEEFGVGIVKVGKK